jgi:hypothetical protein
VRRYFHVLPILIGCAQPRQPPAVAPPPPLSLRPTTLASVPTLAAEPPPPRRVTLATRGCFGDCPSFELTLDGQGRVEHNGEKYVATCGYAAGAIPAADAARVLDAFASAPFTELRPRYVTRQDGCALVATDNSTFWVTLTVGDLTLSVERYNGCFIDDARVKALDAAIALLLASTKAWSAVCEKPDGGGSPAEAVIDACDCGR